MFAALGTLPPGAGLFYSERLAFYCRKKQRQYRASHAPKNVLPVLFIT